MVCLSSKTWSQPRPLASVSWLSVCRGLSAIIQEGRPRLVFCRRRAALSWSRALTKEHSAVTHNSPAHGLCSHIRTPRDTECAHRTLERLFPEAKLHRWRHKNINLKQTVKRFRGSQTMELQEMLQSYSAFDRSLCGERRGCLSTT